MELGAVEPHYSLEDAAKRFFPGGKITARSLRTEIENGCLPRKKIAGKLVTCATDIARMLELKTCQGDQKALASTSEKPEVLVGLTGLSSMDRRRSARAAALMTFKERGKPSRDTLPAHTRRPMDQSLL
jgi:hypothetical protein